MKIITIEEHVPGGAMDAIISRWSAADAPYSSAATGTGLPFAPDSECFSICDKRVADMDRCGITKQVVSCASQTQYLPPELAPSLITQYNNNLAKAIAKYPGRFTAFAALPWSAPELAALELQRTVKELGFVGAILSGRASPEAVFLDDPQFAPVLAAADELTVPIYIHPAAPLLDVQQVYYAGLGEQLSARLSLYGWGWHHEAGIQLLRLILSGAFEKYPNLQIIAGHWGEMIPFFLSRLDQALPQSVTRLNTSITDTFRKHVYVTPSGIFDNSLLKFCIEVLGDDRIIHSVDFPFIPNNDAFRFLEDAPISVDSKERIAYQNAENLFHIA